MTPREHRDERDKKLAQGARLIADALPEHFGSVQVNLQNGKPVNVNVMETVRLQTGEAR